MQKYPFISLGLSLAIARVMTAIFFMAHAIVRIINGTIPPFGEFMTKLGFPAGEAIVWIITVSEVVAGSLLIANRYVRFATIPLLAIAVGGIALIHMHIGWFVGEHGTGGSEYSVALIVLLLVIATADREAGWAGNRKPVDTN